MSKPLFTNDDIMPEFLWRTHIPSLTVHKVKVKDHYIHKNKDGLSLIVENWKDKDKETRVILSKNNNQLQIAKMMFHLSEEEAYKRIAFHLKSFLKKARYTECTPTNKQLDSIIDIISEKYPELIL